MFIRYCQKETKTEIVSLALKLDLVIKECTEQCDRDRSLGSTMARMEYPLCSSIFGCSNLTTHNPNNVPDNLISWGGGGRKRALEKKKKKTHQILLNWPGHL